MIHLARLLSIVGACLVCWAGPAAAQTDPATLDDPSAPASTHAPPDPTPEARSSRPLDPHPTRPFASRLGLGTAGAAIGGSAGALGGTLLGLAVAHAVCEAEGASSRGFGCTVPHLVGSMVGAGVGLLAGVWLGTLLGADADPGLALVGLALALLTAALPALVATLVHFEVEQTVESIFTGLTLGTLNLMFFAPLFTVMIDDG